MGVSHANYESQEDAEQARKEAEELNDALDQKATEFGQVMEAAADGDLTQRMDPQSPSDAMTRVAETFNDMMDDLEETMVSIQTFADDVATASEDVTVSTEEVVEVTEEASSDAANVSAATEEQTSSLSEVSNSAQTLSDRAEELKLLLGEFSVEDEASVAADPGSKVAADGGSDDA